MIPRKHSLLLPPLPLQSRTAADDESVSRPLPRPAQDVSRGLDEAQDRNEAAAAADALVPRCSSAQHVLSRLRVADVSHEARPWYPSPSCPVPTPARGHAAPPAPALPLPPLRPHPRSHLRPHPRPTQNSDPSMRKREPPQQAQSQACARAHASLLQSESDENPNADLSLEDAVLDNSSGNAKDVETGLDSRVDAVDGVTIASRLQEVAFLLADGTVSVFLTFTVIVVDAAFFLAFLVYILLGDVPARFQTAYIILDILTGVTYCCEVNFRLFSYGFWYYCHSLLRVLDYTVSVSNAVVVLSSLTYARRTKWLLIIRYLRLVRVLTVTTMTRERYLRAQTRAELQDLADLLDQERSDQSRLVKWRIDPEAIALGEAAGKGMFGAVFLGLFRGTLVAVKQLYQSNDAAQEYATIEDEAVTLVNLRHPNIVLFMGFVHEPDKLWIVTEYCSRGSIRDLLDKPDFHLTQSRILKLALGAARGLAYLHGQDPPVLHLDLKTSNILVSSGWDTKLADFGLSRNVDNIQNNTFAGTIQYSAPEILESNLFGTAADIYSFGVCLWEMAARETPFKDSSPMDVLWSVVKQNRRPPLDIIRARPDDKDVSTKPRTNGHLSHLESFTVTQSPSSIDPASTTALETDLVTFLKGRQAFLFSEQPGTAKHIEVDSRRPLSKPAFDPPTTIQVASFRPKVPRGVEISPSPSESPNSSVEPHQGGSDAARVAPRHANNVQVVEAEHNLPRRSPFSPILSSGNKTARILTEAEELLTPPAVALDYAAAKLEMTVKPPATMPNVMSEGQSEWSSLLSAKILLYDDRPLVAKRAPIPSSIPSIATAKMMETFRLKKRSIENSSLETDPGDTDWASSVADRCSEKKLTPITTFQQRLESLSNLAGRSSVILVPEDADRELGVEDEYAASAADQDLEREKSMPTSSEDFGSVHMSKEYVELIENCWAQAPGDRPSADEVVWRLVGLIDEHIRRGTDKHVGISDWHN